MITDNSGVSGDDVAGTVVDITGTSEVRVDLLTVGDNVYLHVATPNLHFIAKELLCGTGSTLKIHDDVIFTADQDKSYTQLTCSLVLTENSEVRLPEKTALLGAGNVLEGTNLILISIHCQDEIKRRAATPEA